MRLTWRTFPLFFWGQFLTGFCFHLVLPAVLLFLAGLVLGALGVRFGLFYLVWNEYPFKQAIIGFAVMLLTWEVLLVGYLLEAQRTAHADRFRFQRGGPALAYLVGIFLSSLLILGLIVAGYALVKVLTPPETTPIRQLEPEEMEWHPPYYGLPFAAGALLAIALGVYFTSLRWIDPASRPFMRRIGAMIFRMFARFPLLGVRKPDDEDLYLHGVAALSWLVAFLFFFMGGYFLPWFSPIIGICFLLHIVVAVFAFISYFVPRVTPFILLLLFGLLWLGGMPRYKQRFPGLEKYYDRPVSLGERDAVPDPPLLKLNEIDFCKRELGIHPANMKRPLVVVCASGGGLRSAAWTLAILQEVEKRLAEENILFPHHIRLINGASGGMLGSSCYALSLRAPDDSTPRQAAKELRTQLMEDSLSPVVHQLAYGDLWSMFWPRPVQMDRGRELERAWKDNLNGLLEVSFDSLREGEQAGWRPSLVFTPMLIEDGRRLFVSNLDLDDLAQNRTNSVPGVNDSVLSTSAFEFFRLYPDEQTRKEFKVATATRMSASFPYVAPAVPLPTVPRRRVVDAGYYDNYGVSLPAAWLMSRDTVTWMHRYVSGVLLIQIRDGQLDQQRPLSKGILADTSRPLSRGVEEVTSPPEGLVTGQDSAAIFRNDQQLEMLGQLLAHEVRGRRVEKNFFTTVTFELTKKASLSWYLTEDEKHLIEAEAETTVGKRIDDVKTWWKSRQRDIPVK